MSQARPSRGIEAVTDIRHMRERASRRLPRAIFDAVDGGAGDELSLHENRLAYDRIGIRPRALADVLEPDLKVTVLGRELAMPLLLGPVGHALRMDPVGELGCARAVVDFGTNFVLHQSPAYPIELVAEAAQGRLWAQMYLPPEREITQRVIERLVAAGCDALFLTIDANVPPRTRARDHRNRFTTPTAPYPTARTLMRAGVSRPRWAMRMYRALKTTRPLYGEGRPRHWNYAHSTAPTWDDVQWLREAWPGKLVIKGVQRGDEVDRMIGLGIDGIVVSNHGARYLDTARATIDILPEVVDAAGGRVDVLVDGGIRRGTDVLKALALGADAVLVGKAYMYGLAAGGEPGVRRVLDIFRTEIGEAMALAGCPKVADVDRSIVT